VRSRAGNEGGQGNVLEPFEGVLNRYGLAGRPQPPDPGLPPFQGGMIGFFGYDLAPRLERLPRKAQPDSRIPDIRFALYDTAVTLDHETGSVELWAHDLLREGERATGKRFRAWLRALEQASARMPARSRLGPVESNFRRDDYLAAVQRALDYIAAGDVFQVNLSQRFIARGEPVPLDLFLRLRLLIPVPAGVLPGLGFCGDDRVQGVWLEQLLAVSLVDGRDPVLA